MTDAPQDDLLCRVADAIDRLGLLRAGEVCVVGVSGGADSVALLAALRELAKDPHRRYHLLAAHLNHMIRPDAGLDADFVRDLCHQWQIEVRVGTVDVPAEAARCGLGLEDTARRVRYEFLSDAARQGGASALAVAHHADDNAETILHRVLRGTGLRGLAGIPAQRDLAGVRLIRPLLSCRRATIEAFLAARGITWREDSTNRDEAYRRNFIRHRLLPLVRGELNPQVDQALVRLAEQAAQAQDFVETAAKCLLPADVADLSIDVAKLSATHVAVRAQALRMLIERAVPMREVGADAIAAALRLIDDPTAPPVNLPHDWQLRRRENMLVVEPPADQSPPVEMNELPLAVPGCTMLPDGRMIEVEVLDYDASMVEEHIRQAREAAAQGVARVSPTSTRVAGVSPASEIVRPAVELIDADRIAGPLRVRTRRDGDALRPLGSQGRQSVSDFLTNLKLPPDRRRQVLCILDDQGIVYLAPLRIDERIRVGSQTRRVIRIRVT